MRRPLPTSHPRASARSSSPAAAAAAAAAPGAAARRLRAALAPGLLVAVLITAPGNRGADAGAGAGAGPDWQAAAEVPVIEVVTTDPDGDVRVTKVWFVLIDGVPYLRTNASRWLANIERGSPVRVRIEGREYPVRAERVEGDAIIEAVDAASLAKYGWQERFIHFFRTSKPDILRLSPAAAAPAPGAA